MRRLRSDFVSAPSHSLYIAWGSGENDDGRGEGGKMAEKAGGGGREEGLGEWSKMWYQTGRY